MKHGQEKSDLFIVALKPASWLKTRSNTPFPYLPDLSNRCRTAAISH
jgi:hypothetical protein